MKTLGLDLEAIRRARPAVATAAIRTPLVRLNVWDAPSEIYLKLENLQPIGSFKIRGAANAMSAISEAELQQGVLVASAGIVGIGWFVLRGDKLNRTAAGVDLPDATDQATVRNP